MADPSERAAKMARGGSACTPADWEPAPLSDDVVIKILQKLSSEPSTGQPAPSSHFLVCKRWLALAKEAQQHFEPRETGTDQSPLLLRALAQFPNLTSVSLSGRDVSDFLLWAVAGLCPKLLRLSLRQSSLREFLGRRDTSPRLSPRACVGLADRLTDLSEILMRSGILQQPSGFTTTTLADRCLGLIQSESGSDAPAEPSSLTPAGIVRALRALTGIKSLTYSLDVALPDAVSALQNLESLNIVHDSSDPLPNSLGALSSLRSLNIRKLHPDVKLPPAIWQLQDLDTLELGLGRSPLDPIFPDDSNLPSLRRMSLQCTSLAVMNKSLTRLRNLEELTLACENLRALPAGFHKLTKLRKLYLDTYEMRTFPRCLAGQTARLPLEELTLSYLHLPLRGGLACLSSTLRRLEINWFSHVLPDELGSLSRLQHLSLNNCSAVKHLPESFSDLTSLQELRLYECNSLEALPGVLPAWPRLRVLAVSSCPGLKTLPADLGDAPELRELRLEDLRLLTHLPQSLANARNLRVLRVEHCPQARPFHGLLSLPSLDEDSRRALAEAVQ